MARILGIDPGTKCGWAILEDGERVVSGTWDLSVRRNESEGMRFLRLEQQLRQLLRFAIESTREFRWQYIDLVAFEDVKRHRGTIAAHVYGGITAIIKQTCARLGVPYQGILVQDIKRRATGKGNANKDAMVAAAVERWGVSNLTEDEADALWIALCGTELLGVRQA